MYYTFDPAGHCVIIHVSFSCVFLAVVGLSVLSLPLQIP